jgi:hypothetical protein
MTTQPEALRLADLLDQDRPAHAHEAAAELRRLHEVEVNAQDRIDRLYLIYKQACRHRDQLMDEQRAQIAAMRGKIQ